MKGIGLILFGMSMFLLGIFSILMLMISDWYLWMILIIIGLCAGIIASITGLIVVCRKTPSRDPYCIRGNNFYDNAEDSKK